jgi:hypothetical protein
MNKTIPRVMLGFVAVFVVGMAVLLIVQSLWWDPSRACEERGAWWDPSTRVCATPVTLDKLTHRPFGARPAAKP